jgi:hypothetical protein
MASSSIFINSGRRQRSSIFSLQRFSFSPIINGSRLPLHQQRQRSLVFRVQTLHSSSTPLSSSVFNNDLIFSLHQQWSLFFSIINDFLFTVGCSVYNVMVLKIELSVNL